VGWRVGWVQRGDEVTPFALNIAMAGGGDATKREQLGRRNLQLMGVLPAGDQRPPDYWISAAMGSISGQRL